MDSASDIFVCLGKQGERNQRNIISDLKHVQLRYAVNVMKGGCSHICIRDLLESYHGHFKRDIMVV